MTWREMLFASVVFTPKTYPTSSRKTTSQTQIGGHHTEYLTTTLQKGDDHKGPRNSQRLKEIKETKTKCAV
jgi:hypothetical protein